MLFYGYCSHFDTIKQTLQQLPLYQMPFCSSIPKNLPDFYIEVTSENFRKGSKTVMDSSYLSNNWETLKIYRIPPFLAGTYLLYDLHKNPHYMLNHNQRKQFQKEANSKSIDIYDVIQSTTEIENEIYHYSHESNVYKQHVLPYEKEFCLPEIIEKLKAEEKVSKRGNWAINKGWQGQNMTFQHIMTVPRYTPLSDLDRKIFNAMTKIVLSIYTKKLKVAPFTGHQERRELFAQHLMKEPTSQGTPLDNVFESVTYAMTYCKKKVGAAHNLDLLKPHIDSQNCRDDSYNVVFSVYFYFQTTQHDLIRVVFVGYSRKSIGDYFRRFQRRTLFKEHLMKYISIMEQNDSTRLHLSLGNSVTPSKEAEPILTYKIPFMDKCAYYSVFCSAIYDLLKSDAGASLKMSQILEIVLPISWLTTGSNYYLIIKNWQRNGVPDGHLTVEVIRSLVDMGGSLSSGKGPRMQPFMNRPIPLHRINSGLKIIFNIIKKANANVEECYLEEFLTELKNKVFGVGWLSAHHLISILCLLRIIKNPAYIRKAMPLKGTLTNERIESNYNINHKTACALYEEIGREKFGGCTRIVENLGCEFFRDISNPYDEWDENTYNKSVKERCSGRSISHPDIFYSGQSLFLETNKKIFRLYYDSSHESCKEELKNIFNMNDYAEDISLKWTETENQPFIPIKKPISNIPPKKKRKIENMPMNLNLEYEYCEEQKKIIQLFYYHHDHTMPTYDDLFESEFGTHIDGSVYEDDLHWVVSTLVKLQSEHKKPISKKKTKKKQKKKNQYGKISISSNAIIGDDKKMKNIYTSWVPMDTQVLFLNLGSEKQYPNGFSKYSVLDKRQRSHNEKKFGMGSSNRTMAFYNTESEAKIAIMIKIFTTEINTNIVHHLNSRKKFQNNKLGMVFIFHKPGSGKSFNTNNFFGVVSKSKTNEFKLHVPSNIISHIFQPWHTFPIKC